MTFISLWHFLAGRTIFVRQSSREKNKKTVETDNSAASKKRPEQFMVDIVSLSILRYRNMLKICTLLFHSPFSYYSHFLSVCSAEIHLLSVHHLLLNHMILYADLFSSAGLFLSRSCKSLIFISRLVFLGSLPPSSFQWHLTWLHSAHTDFHISYSERILHRCWISKGQDLHPHQGSLPSPSWQ